MTIKRLFTSLLIFTALHAIAQVKTPAQLYPTLFKSVQMNRVYADGKTFPDAIPLRSTAFINKAYKTAAGKLGFDLRSFVHKYFEEPLSATPTYKSDPNKSLRQHIDTLWSVLERDPDTTQNSSLIPLPYPYIVPGGRFREIYYWDSYFTMLGLQQANRFRLIQDMVANFAYLLDHYGLIPNGNRTYYLSRSQPPFFSLMVRMLAADKGQQVLVNYRPQLLEEYNFWMKGAVHIKPGMAYRHVVKLPGGTVLNRYWDASDKPREESYREDVLAAKTSKQKPAAFYRNIRAAAESGWDFSSRWFADGRHLSSIQTTNLIPVDLNCLLYNLEKTIARSYEITENKHEAAIYETKALNRKNAILKYCWDKQKGCFTDYNWKTHSHSPQLTIATAFPLFFKIASPAQARQVAMEIRNKFMKAGGVATTLTHTGQQWDRPNGWAPLQYITITGLNNYKYDSLAREIALRWISRNTIAYKQSGKLLEKYNIESEAKAGGGEYPLQDGFGWTNGVLLTLMNEYKVQ